MSPRPAKNAPCELCERQVALQFHHLIPRKVHRRAHYRTHYSKAELAEGVFLCRKCHRAIHRFFDEMTLAKQLNTLGSLRAMPEVQKHVEWVKKQKEV